MALRIRLARQLALALVPALVAASAACRRPQPAVSLEPEELIATARLPAGVKLELVAREPNVVDPVAIAFDADGRMFVVEMRDYPIGLGPSGVAGGRVRLLEDRDLDGFYEHSTIFADGLQYPTSVVPWRQGAVVTSPPDIVYLRDRDGDGRADERQVLFTGFPVSNTQHNINGFVWGLDNWVYGANGGNNGTVRSPRFPDRTVALQRTDFKFRPSTGEIRTSYESTGGFGLGIDAWGRMFGTHNTIHIQHMPLQTDYLARSPDVTVPATRQMISDHGASAQLFQISDAETRFNHPEQSGHFSGGCGLTYYGGGALGPAYDGSLFVTDVVVNVVHQDVVAPDGAGFRARRAEEGAEFLAARDNWFRPVYLATGPEGALYVVDMHRAVIEHPEWIPEAVQRRVDLRAGENKGRIYRVVPSGGLPPVRPALERASIESLVAALEHPNKWRRDTAQRLLVERGDRAAAPLLADAARGSRSALARLHALWTLEGLGALDDALVAKALADPHAGVRENALRLAEPRLKAAAALRDAVVGMRRDPDPRVRFQLALALDPAVDPRASEALLEIARQDLENEASRGAILVGLAREPGAMLERLVAATDPYRVSARFETGGADLVRRLAAATAARRSAPDVARVLRLVRASGAAEPLRVALLDGLADGLARGASAPFEDPALRRALDPLVRSRSTPLVRAALRLARAAGAGGSAAQDEALARARTSARDGGLPLEVRLAEVELLGLGSFAQSGETLLELMEPRHPGDLQAAAARAASQIADEEMARRMLAAWRRYAPRVKSITLTTLVRRPAFHPLLLDALEKRALTFGELNLDLEQRRRLLRHSTPDVKKRAAALFGDHEFSNRRALVDQLLPQVVGLRGDATRGQVQFKNLCARCHALRGMGQNAGPDLAMAYTKGKEDLLTSILDPNAAIEPQYTNYLVVTARGDQINGLLKSETPAGVTLVRGGGESDDVLRRDIREMRTDGLSLMPEGLEQGLKPQDLADLVAFLQQR